MAHPTSAHPSVRLAADDHRRLRILVDEIDAALAGRGPRRAHGPDVAAARLALLRGLLRAHFDEEERAGLFDQIVEIAPDQARACSLLRAEHGSLLARLDELRAAGPEARRYATWTSGVRALLDTLSAHEARESEILTRVLDGGAPAQD